jgi:ATP-dependent RNA helicase DeaD
VTQPSACESFACSVDPNASLAASDSTPTSPPITTISLSADPIATDSQKSPELTLKSVDLTALETSASTTTVVEAIDEVSTLTVPLSTTETPAEPKNGFASFGFSAELLEAVEGCGYTEPSPIQKAAIPELQPSAPLRCWCSPPRVNWRCR